MATSLDVSGLCEENFTCQGAAATISCLDCGTLQCNACDEFFHVGKLASHTRREILSKPLLCERECDKIATVRCDQCGVKLCGECDKLLHVGRKRSNHVTTKLPAAVEQITVTKQITEENVEEEESKYSSFLLVNDKEELMVTDAEEFIAKLGCSADSSAKVVSIFGNTGDGKSFTLNQAFFSGSEVFCTSASQFSCTVGVWAAYCDGYQSIVIDTEGLLGASSDEHQRNRLLMKIFAISDLIVYRTRAERLHNDMFNFIGDASEAYLKYFTPELRDLSQRYNNSSDVPLSMLGPTVVIFHETRNTYPLGTSADVSDEVISAEKQLMIRFSECNKLPQAFSSIEYVGVRTTTLPTDFVPFQKCVAKLLTNNSVRTCRSPSVIFDSLKALNQKFSGEIDRVVVSTFPDEYFSCRAECRACGVRCARSMNHERDGSLHSAPAGTSCKFVHQLNNQVHLCNICHGNGEESEVIPKSYSSQDTSWTGMMKYAWSGYVLECPTCGVIYRSRQYWYGNPDHEGRVTRSKIIHLWPGDAMRSSDGTHSSRRLLEGVEAVVSAIGNVTSVPSKVVSGWVTDQIAPSYWTPNSQIKSCNGCETMFGPNDIKHHCRACGEGFCNDCSSHSLPVPWRGWGSTPVRVCNDCHAYYGSNSTSNSSELDKQQPASSNNSSSKVSTRLVGEALANAMSSAVNYSKNAITDATRPNYWIPDYQITHCHQCKNEFKLAAIKHHCRACGQGFCDGCSSHKACVPSRGWDTPVRVCDHCYKKLTSLNTKNS